MLLGAVVAGDRSRRFGSDKAMALHHGKPLLAHAAEALAQHTQAVILCGRTMAGFTCLADRPIAVAQDHPEPFGAIDAD